jgi:hypothetical protein
MALHGLRRMACSQMFPGWSPCHSDLAGPEHTAFVSGRLALLSGTCSYMLAFGLPHLLALNTTIQKYAFTVLTF